MTIMHTSRHTDVATVDYSSLHTQQKLHHCVTDVRQQYPIAPLFRSDLEHAQTMCTRLSLHDPQNVSGCESGNEAKTYTYRAYSTSMSSSHMVLAHSIWLSVPLVVNTTHLGYQQESEVILNTGCLTIDI